MTKILYVQPILTSYRIPVVNGLASLPGVDVSILAGEPSNDFGNDFTVNAECCFFKVVKFGIFKQYAGFLSFFRKKKFDAVIHFADFKYISLWYFLFYKRHKKLYLHGQGGYKKNGLFHSIFYNAIVLLSDGYICYNHFSADALKKVLLKRLHHKVTVVENTLYLPVFENRPEQISTDLFYVGRLREGCGIEFLLDAAKIAGVNVRVVGGCEPTYLKSLQQNYPDCIFYGAIFDTEEQYDIAASCMAGAYGGDAGLSVVHYMAFGLPVIVHNDIAKHMGPEPSYVENGVNGLTFNRGNVESLASKINELKQAPELQQRLSEGAIATFKRLQTPPMHEKFAKILGIL